jgi:hypothetical protein
MVQASIHIFLILLCQISSFGTEKVAMQAEKNALSAERKQLEQKLKNTENELIMAKNLKAQAELR